jgi:hypothetical protein
MTVAELNPEFRNLIDARLDAIDQVLCRARLPWSERRSIVGEVETQIFELLARGTESPSREGVLAVLDTLDPPEAYLPDELRAAPADTPPSAAKPRTIWPQWPRHTVRLASRFVSGALRFAALLLINLIIFLIIRATGGLIPWLVTVGALVWLNYQVVRGYRSWSASGGTLDDFRHRLATWILPRNGVQPT